MASENLYVQCLALVEERRRAQLRNTSKRREGRFQRFMAGHDEAKWRRRGKRVVFA